MPARPYQSAQRRHASAHKESKPPVGVFRFSALENCGRILRAVIDERDVCPPIVVKEGGVPGGASAFVLRLLLCDNDGLGGGGSFNRLLGDGLGGQLGRLLASLFHG